MSFNLPPDFADRVNGAARALTECEGEPDAERQADLLLRSLRLACSALQSLNFDQIKNEAIKTFSVASYLDPQWPNRILGDLEEFHLFLERYEGTALRNARIDENARHRIISACGQARPFVQALIGKVQSDPIQLAEMRVAGMVSLRTEICHESQALQEARDERVTAGRNRRKVRWLNRVLTSVCGPINLATPIPEPHLYAIWTATSTAIGLLGGWFVDYPDE